MYSLHLSPEQLEIRDTVRDFVTEKIKPVMLEPERLNVCDRRLSMAVLDQASQMGLRTLALSEDHGGAGADHLTSCIVAEELAAGDADLAAALTETSRLAHLIFDEAMTDAQRDRFLPQFLKDDRHHLAFAEREAGGDTKLGVNYHRSTAPQAAIKTTAVKAADGQWSVNGRKTCVANAPIAALFAVLVNVPDRAIPKVLLVPADAAGLDVHAGDTAWLHGCHGDVSFKDCRVAADNMLNDSATVLLTGADAHGREMPLLQAIDLGIGRAAYTMAVDYAKLRVQGGRPIIEHQAIATKLADIAIRLEVARAIVWQAAWASDHSAAVADRSLSDLPLTTIAQVFTGETILQAVKDAAEVFGAMGVMRDMPLQKYVHDARVCLHSGDGNGDARLRLAEVIARYRRGDVAVPATAAE